MGMRVLVTSPAMLGHLHPMVPLARAVAARAHDVLGALSAAADLGVPSVPKGSGPPLPASRFAPAAREVAPLWRSRGLEPRPYGGSYDTLSLDSSPPILQAHPADHVARRQLMRPHRDDGEFDESSALPFPEEPASSPLVYVTMGTVFNDVKPLRVTVEALRDLPV